MSFVWTWPTWRVGYQMDTMTNFLTSKPRPKIQHAQSDMGAQRQPGADSDSVLCTRFNGCSRHMGFQVPAVNTMAFAADPDGWEWHVGPKRFSVLLLADLDGATPAAAPRHSSIAKSKVGVLAATMQTLG